MAYELYYPNIKKRNQNKPDSVKYNAKLGKITLKKQVREKYFKDDDGKDVNYAQVFYDRETGRLAIKPVEQEDNAVKITGEKSKAIMMKRIMSRFNIEMPNIDMELPVQEEDGMISFKVS